MNNQDRKAKIMSSIAQAKDKGYALIYGEWGSSDGKCACALGCILIAEGKSIQDGNDGELMGAADILETSDDWAASFIDGFDNNGVGNLAINPDAWNLGYEVRNLTSPMEYGEWLEKANYD